MSNAFPRPVPRKRLEDIGQEWDSAADQRLGQLLSGNDLSFDHVLVPVTLDLASVASRRDVLDAGCGVGVLTQKLAEISDEVVGIDISTRSVQLARSTHPRANLRFEASSVEQYARTRPREFSLVVANMVLMTTPDLAAFVEAAARLLRPGGAFVFTIPHPYFWPRYWEYEDEAWFNYFDEITIEAPFRISLEQHGSFATTHVHRPLSRYIGQVHASGMRIDAFSEPKPPAAVESRYPARWRFPRYIAIRALLTENEPQR